MVQLEQWPKVEPVVQKYKIVNFYPNSLSASSLEDFFISGTTRLFKFFMKQEYIGSPFLGI